MQSQSPRSEWMYTSEAAVKLGMVLVNLRIADASEIFPSGISNPPTLKDVALPTPLQTDSPAQPAGTVSGKSDTLSEPAPSASLSPQDAAPAGSSNSDCSTHGPLHKDVEGARAQLLVRERSIHQSMEALESNRRRHLRFTPELACRDELSEVLRCYHDRNSAVEEGKGTLGDFLNCRTLVDALAKCAKQAAARHAQLPSPTTPPAT